MDPVAIGIAVGGVAGSLVLVFVVLTKAAVSVGADRALVVTGPGGHTRVAFGATFVPPFVVSAEMVDLGVKTIELSRTGRDGFSCRDGVRAEVECALTIAVERREDAILKVAQTFGAARTFDLDALRQAFQNRLAEALAAVIVMFDMDELVRNREDLKDRVLEVIGRDLDGWVVQDLAIGRVEQAPLDAHDPQNIRDARGIRKITEETVREAQYAAEIEREHRVRRAQLRADAEIHIADILAHRSDVFGKLQMATGQRVDLDAVERELDDRLRALSKLDGDGAAAS